MLLSANERRFDRRVQCVEAMGDLVSKL